MSLKDLKEKVYGLALHEDWDEKAVNKIISMIEKEEKKIEKKIYILEKTKAYSNENYSRANELRKVIKE